MNVLFLSLLKFSSFEERNIYTDLLRQLIKKGCFVYAVCPSERRNSEKTNVKKNGANSILTVKTYNIQKTNLFEKGIGTLAIKRQFIKAINKYLRHIKFDLILYTTPPITLYGVVRFFKKRDNAKTYLMLKDIFPQNAVDLGMIKTTGFWRHVYNYFRKKEKQLYSISDRIGCMSPANVEYILKHNNEICKDKLEVFPNCIEIRNVIVTDEQKKKIRNDYGLPLDKKIFVYGGNLGKPQDIPFIISCLKATQLDKEAFFLIVGDGTEYNKLEHFYNDGNQKNLMLVKRLPNDVFDTVLACCDVGLIFLDNRFTIPNFPSRLLSYLQAGLPVLACTDIFSDVGKIIVDNQIGWWCQSNRVENFVKTIKMAIENSNSVSKEFVIGKLLNLYSLEKESKKIIDFLNNSDRNTLKE